MPEYRSPGVYVEEVPSGAQPIAGVSTSTPGFIGIVPDTIVIPLEAVTKVPNESIGTGASGEVTFDLDGYPVLTTPGTFEMRVGNTAVAATLTNNYSTGVSQVTFDPAPADGEAITGDYTVVSTAVTDEAIGTGDGQETSFELARYPVSTVSGTFEIQVDGAAPTGVITLSNDPVNEVSRVTFDSAPADDAAITGDYLVVSTFSPVAPGEVKLCTNFSEFKKFFGDFSTDVGQNMLAHAVYGFFNNGGSRCYVVRARAEGDITGEFLTQTFEPIDEIALVAAPGITDNAIRAAIVTHCKINTGDRFAIFDSPETVEDSSGNLNLTLLDPSNTSNILPDNSDYAAFYFPWIQVFDPATKTMEPTGDGRVYMPPSGYMAGIYARVDSSRGVYKAPANETVFGALGLKYQISKNQQDGLNPQGVNCIRDLNGNIRVWGARTIGGDQNGEWKYINIRRLFLFLRESIDEGTQWVVFEPNTPDLWAKITRNITSFLTIQWRSGALFGNTPQEAFFVQCDAETNPPELRDLGQLVTVIGVAPVKPAEFVIFRISQRTLPS